MFNVQEFERYNRHIILPEIGLQGQLKLKQTKVLVVGAGGLGCPALQYLAAAGVGNISIIDHDLISISNLQRQILYSEEDIGKPKVEIAKEKLLKQNPHINIFAYYSQLTTHNSQLINEYDIILDGSDNFPTRYLINDACLFYNKPFVSGSIFKFEGQLSVFNYKNGPSYRCLFPEPPQPEEMPNCSEIGVLGVVPGIIGTLQANEAIKIITGIGEVLDGKLLIINALTLNAQIISFSRNENAIKTFKKLYPDIENINYQELCFPAPSPSRRGGEYALIKELTSEQLKILKLKNELFQLIDVRETEEYEKENINGVLIPLSQLENNIGKIRRDIPVIIHCHSGKRSEKAIRLLQEKHEFNNLYNLEGGILECLKIGKGINA
jgi:adenylyltransferase/sulfurtransferase